jgi:hypothetical protein
MRVLPNRTVLPSPVRQQRRRASPVLPGSPPVHPTALVPGVAGGTLGSTQGVAHASTGLRPSAPPGTARPFSSVPGAAASVAAVDTSLESSTPAAGSPVADSSAPFARSICTQTTPRPSNAFRGSSRRSLAATASPSAPHAAFDTSPAPAPDPDSTNKEEQHPLFGKDQETTRLPD